VNFKSRRKATCLALLQAISHEMRSPLARLKLAVDLAKQYSGPARDELFERIESEADRIEMSFRKFLHSLASTVGSLHFRELPSNCPFLSRISWRTPIL
jgi:K+-sensing histidine kinase KdpD